MENSLICCILVFCGSQRNTLSCHKDTCENSAFRNISLEIHVFKGLRSHEAKFNIHQTLVHRMLFTDNARSHLHLQTCSGNPVGHLVLIFHLTVEFLYFDLYSFILKLRSRLNQFCIKMELSTSMVAFGWLRHLLLLNVP